LQVTFTPAGGCHRVVLDGHEYEVPNTGKLDVSAKRSRTHLVKVTGDRSGYSLLAEPVR
jgi:hypothetical protein